MCHQRKILKIHLVVKTQFDFKRGFQDINFITDLHHVKKLQYDAKVLFSTVLQACFKSNSKFVGKYLTCKKFMYFGTQKWIVFEKN